MLRVVALISGSGTNLRALIEAAESPEYPAELVAVGADRDAAGLEIAARHGIPTFVVPYRAHADREAWGAALAAEIETHRPDLTVLSGLMRLLPSDAVARLAPRLINTHPAYLPEFPGAHGVRDALAAGVAQTGASVILVDEGVDTGPIIAQERVPILPGDDEATLHERIKVVERRLLIDVVRGIADGRIRLEALAQATTGKEVPR